MQVLCVSHGQRRPHTPSPTPRLLFQLRARLLPPPVKHKPPNAGGKPSHFPPSVRLTLGPSSLRPAGLPRAEGQRILPPPGGQQGPRPIPGARQGGQVRSPNAVVTGLPLPSCEPQAAPVAPVRRGLGRPRTQAAGRLLGQPQDRARTDRRGDPDPGTGSYCKGTSKTSRTWGLRPGDIA